MRSKTFLSTFIKVERSFCSSVLKFSFNNNLQEDTLFSELLDYSLNKSTVGVTKHKTFETNPIFVNICRSSTSWINIVQDITTALKQNLDFNSLVAENWEHNEKFLYYRFGCGNLICVIRH